MSIFKRFNGVIPLLLLLCFAVAQPGWASSPTPTMMGGPSLPPDEEPATRADKYFYTIVCESNPTIGGDIVVPSFAAAGETVYFTVTPSDGYIVTYVSGSYSRYSGSTYDYTVQVQKDENTGQYYFVMPNGNVRISASFNTLYNITTECYPPEGGSITDCPTQAYGSANIKWRVTTNEGYYLNFTGPEGNSFYYSNQPNSDGQFSCNMSHHDMKIIANFGTNTEHNITSTSEPDQVGTVSVVPSAMPGDNVSVTITGTEDYTIYSARYTYDGLGTNRSLDNTNTDYLNNKFTGTFTMPAADVNIHVQYDPLYTLNAECIPANAGTIATGLTFSDLRRPLYYGNKFTGSGEYIYYKVTPQSGYTIDKIIVTYINQNGETITQEKQYYPNTPNRNYIYFYSISGDASITAVFKPYGITTECVPADGGTISVPSTASSGDQVNFTVTPSQNHLFKDLTITTVNGNTVPFQFNEETGQGTFTMPNYPVHIVVNFNSLHTINLACDPSDAGEMMIMYEELFSGNENQFAVMPYEGFMLGSVTSTSSNFEYQFVEHVEEEYEGVTYIYDVYSFIMPDEDITLTAHFIPVGTRYNITAINETPERGTVDVVETAQPLETVHVTIQGTESFTCIGDSLKLYYYDENHDKKSISIKASNIDYDNNVYTVDFVMPAADVYVEPVFEPLYSITTVCTPSESGTLSIESENGLFYGYKCLENSEIHLTRSANDGYGLVSVSFTGQNEEGEQITNELSPYDLGYFDYFGYYTFTMLPSDVTITATFGRIHSVSTSWSPDEGGTIEGGTMVAGGPTSQCAAGMDYMFYVHPNVGFDFDSSDISVTYVNQNNETVSIPIYYEADSYGSYFHFTMPDADVMIQVEFKPVLNLNVIIDPENGGFINEIITNTQTYYNNQVSIGAGRQVKISLEAYNGYILQGVSLITINETTGEEEVTPLTASDGYYTLTMPDVDATVKATFTEMPTLYLLGTANGNSAWHTSGVPFEIIDGQYTATVYFKGYSDDENETDGMGYFMLSTASDDTDNWDVIKDNLLSAPSDKFPALQDGENSSVQQLYNEYHYDGTLSHRFMIPAGIYKITVSPYLISMTIDRITPTITFSPELYNEPIGQAVTVSGLDWVLNTILQINPDETDYVEHITVTDAAGTWQSEHFSSKFGLRSPGLTTITATNSVGYITASNTKQYYVFELDFPALEFIEGSNPIDNPTFNIYSGEPVTVGDELIGVWGAKNILWVKDQGQHSTRYLDAPEGTTDFLREVFKIQGREWDQSNWVMLDFGELYPDWETNQETYLAMHEKIASYVDHKIEARTVKGYYLSPGYFYRSSNSIFEYTKGMHRILLSEFPVAIEQPASATLGYPGYVEDPTEEAGKFYQDPSQYMYNHYTPVNFMGYVYKPKELKYYPGENPFVYSAGQSALDDVAGDNRRFFFMQPKDAEVAHVWAVWKGSMTFIDDYTSTNSPNFITRDVFETYQPGTDAQGHHYNSYGIEGAFQVYSWEWNRLPATDADQTPRYGKPEEGFEPNTPYLFHIAILHAYNTHMVPPPIPKAPRVDIGMEAGDLSEGMGDDYDAEFGANLGAGSDAIAPIASTWQPNSRYRVFPLDMTRPSDSTTGVDEAVIDRNDAAYEIVDITYYNVMGMASKRPFDGINIEVTTYSDGHKTSRKILTRN